MGTAYGGITGQILSEFYLCLLEKGDLFLLKYRMSALSSQLAQLRLARGVGGSGTKASLLFDALEAKDIDSETVFDIGISGKQYRVAPPPPLVFGGATSQFLYFIPLMSLLQLKHSLQSKALVKGGSRHARTHART